MGVAGQERQPAVVLVQSSVIVKEFEFGNVRRVVLDEVDEVAEVTFASGDRRRFKNLTPKLLEEWGKAVNPATWFTRVVKGNPHRFPVSDVGRDAPTLDAEPTKVEPPQQSQCTHTMLRAANEGICPVCDPEPTKEPDAVPVVAGDPDPPSVLHTDSAHDPSHAKALTRVTREEAQRLLVKLKARRMRHSLRDFIRGTWDAAESKWVGGAWDVVEPGVSLEWNWHHDAIVQHTQAMFEEWRLAGLASSEAVKKQLRAWVDQRAPGTLERELATGYLAHWRATGSELYKQRTHDLAINVGPISLKSRIVMVMSVAWMWLEVPAWEVFCASGTPSNVSRDSLACRDLVTSEWYKNTFAIAWEIKDDLDRIDKWGTTAGGSRESRGAGAAIVGVHADGILIDDPDSSTDVWSEAARRDTMTFWLAVGNRVKDPRRPMRMIVQQNLHEEDLTSRITRGGVPRLAIPVEFDPTARDSLYSAPFSWRDPRKVSGEPIHAARFTAEVIAAERKRLGSHGFEAQYNCNPRPIDGGLIKRSWFQFFRIDGDEVSGRERPTGCVSHAPSLLKAKRPIESGNDIAWMRRETLRTLDLDFLDLTVDATFGSLKETASAVGLLVVGGKDMRRYLFDDASEPMTFHGTIAAIKRLIAKWPIRRVLIELKANGASIIEELGKQIKGGDVLGPDGKPAIVVIESVNPEGGKESRAAAMVPAIESGLVCLLDGASWLEAFVGEVCVFPHAKRDDRVDALSQLMTRYRDTSNVAKWRQLGKR